MGDLSPIMTLFRAVREHPDAELLKLAAERNRLVEIRNPLRVKANQLSEEAEAQWKAKGNLSRTENMDAYIAHCADVGLLTAEDELAAVDEQIYPLDDKIRAIPAQTATGLKVKFDLLRDYLPTQYVDEEPRRDQDFDVCLFNEMGDEIERLAQSTPQTSVSGLHAAIEKFVAAKAEYDAAVVTTGDLPDTDSPAWEAYELAEHELTVYPCQTLDEVRVKARFFLESEGPNDTLRNCFSERGHTLDVFLRSLIGEVQSCD